MLLERWGNLHAVRTTLSVIATVLYVWLIAVSKNSYNLVGLYENGPFSARLGSSYRDESLSEFSEGRPRFVRVALAARRADRLRHQQESRAVAAGAEHHAEGFRDRGVQQFHAHCGQQLRVVRAALFDGRGAKF